MSFFDDMLDRMGRMIARHLVEESSGYQPFTPSDPETLARVLEPCDVVLVEGNQHVSNTIKYLTQSTWSHAALYVGDALGTATEAGEPLTLIEANLGEGVVAAPLSKYRSYNTRICRPVGLTADERTRVIGYARERIGLGYDTRNILDLARYLFPTPPVPVRWRRRLLALGSGSPTRAICSSLIAQAFASIRYPVLPRVERMAVKRRGISDYSRWEILHIRHYSLYAPRDFDLSPYFRVIKPDIEGDFDFRRLAWSAAPPSEGAIGRGRIVEERERLKAARERAGEARGGEDPEPDSWEDEGEAGTPAKPQRPLLPPRGA
ncbi:MAG: YiiX/YebB-like N1pC/P60 family cysteine hydrolase [Hyphomicrobiaceae bacterium]